MHLASNSPKLSTLRPAHRRADKPESRAPDTAAKSGLTAPCDPTLWRALLDDAPVPDECIAELCNRAQVRDSGAGTTLLTRNDEALNLVILANGDATLGHMVPEKPFHPETRITGPHWLDASSTWLGGHYALDAFAIGSVRLIELPRSEFEPLMQKYAALNRPMLNVLARQVQTLIASTHELRHMDAQARVVAWLMQHATPGAEGTQWVELTDRKRDLAAQLAVTPETLSRLLSDLKRQKLIQMSGYTIQILNQPSLAMYARGR